MTIYILFCKNFATMLIVSSVRFFCSFFYWNDKIFAKQNFFLKIQWSCVQISLRPTFYSYFKEYVSDEYYIESYYIQYTEREFGSASLALAGHPSNDGVTTKMPYGLDVLRDKLRTQSFPIGLVKTESAFIVRSVETGLERWTLVVAVICVDAYPFFWLSQAWPVTLKLLK